MIVLLQSVIILHMLKGGNNYEGCNLPEAAAKIWLLFSMTNVQSQNRVYETTVRQIFLGML